MPRGRARRRGSWRKTVHGQGLYMPKKTTAVVRDPRRNGAPICTAHRSDGRPCGYIAVGGTTKCQRHGGKSLKGLASPNLKHGRYSKHLLPHLAERSAEALRNPRLLSLSDDIALNETLITTCVERLASGESGAAWQGLRSAWVALNAAVARGDQGEMALHHAGIERWLTQGLGQAAVVEELQGLWTTRTKLVQTEMKTLQAMQQLITVQQHLLTVGAQTKAVIDAIAKHADPQTGRRILRDIQAEFDRLATVEEGR